MKKAASYSRKKIISAAMAVSLCISLLTGCGSAGTQATSGTASTAAASSVTTGSTGVKTATASAAAVVSVSYDNADLDATWNTTTATISLKGSSATVEGTGVKESGSKVTITAAGTYVISGALADGQIIVDTTDKDPVRIVLNGASITCSNSAPIYVADAKKVVLILADGTKNTITDGTNYVFADAANKEPNAAIFSKSDLTINGTGSLTVNANYNHGINCKDELKIVSGAITVNAVSDGIKGRDFVAIKDGTINIAAKTDGIQSTNDEDTAFGFVVIDGGAITINSTEDGIQAETNVQINSGTLNITAGGGSGNSVSSNTATQGRMMPGSTAASNASSTTSTKGIKATANITVNGGTITISSADDTLHANANITVNGGTLNLASGDDGFHADASITINDGQINITKSYEGIESALITVNGGALRLTSSDDGFNVAGGADGSSVNGRPGQNNFTANSSLLFSITGGYIFVNAGGDGLDSNGSISMTGGTAIVNGPTDNGNGPLDYNGGFKMTGGLLVAAGSAGMAQAPDTTSTQYAALIGFTSSLQARTLVHIEDAKGNTILTMEPLKTYQSLVICSPSLVKGETYTIYTGGSATGTNTDTLYSGGTYAAGTKIGTFTVSSIVTTYGSATGAGPGGQMKPGRK